MGVEVAVTVAACRGDGRKMSPASSPGRTHPGLHKLALDHKTKGFLLRHTPMLPRRKNCVFCGFLRLKAADRAHNSAADSPQRLSLRDPDKTFQLSKLRPPALSQRTYGAF